MTAPIAPTAASRTPGGAGAAPAAVRMTRIEGELDAHRQLDEFRFEALAAAIAKLELGLAALQAEMREGFDRLGAQIQELQVRLAGSEDGAPAKGHWRIGPFTQWALGLGALAMIALVGWMATQLWLEEPARIRAAQPLDPPAQLHLR